MKQLKMTTCVVLAILLVLLSTTAFAGTKYSDAIGFGTVLPKPTATPEPTEEPLPPTDPTEEPTAEPTAEPTPAPEQPEEEPGYAFERDAEGNLILNENGDPVVLVPEGSKAPTGFERDENGALVLDENGNPIPTFDPVEDEPAVEPTEEPAVEPTEEPVVEPTEEPVVEEPVVESTEEPVVEETVMIPTALGEADVRLEANGLSEIFITLPEGTELVVLEVEGDWIKVDIDGQIGYIYKDSVQGLPVEEPVLPEGSEDVAPEEEMKVTIFSSRRTVMAPGEIIYLTCKLEGLDGYTLTYQWQYDRGNGFEDIPGATEDTYAFEASVETLAYDWSLLVYYE